MLENVDISTFGSKLRSGGPRGPRRPTPPLRPVALFELLARPAPARVVAPDLLVLVDAPLLDRLGKHGHLLLGDLAVLVGRGRGTRLGRGHRDRLRPADGPAPGVGHAAGPRRAAR